MEAVGYERRLTIMEGQTESGAIFPKALTNGVVTVKPLSL